MYLVMAFGLMIVLPIVSVLVELLFFQSTDVTFLIGEWFSSGALASDC